MYGARYFGARYFGASYFGHYGASLGAVSGRFFGQRYFGRRYWGQSSNDVDGAFSGSRYLGNRYFGKRYFGANQTSDPFAIAQTNVLAGSGVTSYSSITLSIGTDWALAQTNSLLGNGAGSQDATLTFNTENWYLENYLQLAQSVGVGALSASFQLGYLAGGGRYFGSRYFGQRYYGPRYWGTLTSWSFEITSHLSGAAAATHSTTLGTAIALVPSSAILSNGAASFNSVSLSFSDPVVVAPTQGAPGKPQKRGFTRYMVTINGRRHFGSEDEIERLIEQFAQTQAEKPKPKRVKITVKPAQTSEPEEKQEAQTVQADMREHYEQAYREALNKLAADRLHEEMEEEEDLLGIL